MTKNWLYLIGIANFSFRAKKESGKFERYLYLERGRKEWQHFRIH